MQNKTFLQLITLLTYITILIIEVMVKRNLSGGKGLKMILLSSIRKKKKTFTLEDLPTDILKSLPSYGVDKRNLMLLNSYFLDLFAPDIYANIHGILCLRTTDYFNNGLSRIASGQSILSCYSSLDEVIECTMSEPKMINTLGNLTTKGTTLITDMRALIHVFDKVVNGSSRLKSYIKKITLDLVIIDDFNSTRPLKNLVDDELVKWSEMVRLADLYPSDFITYDLRADAVKVVNALGNSDKKDLVKRLSTVCDLKRDKRSKNMVMLTQMFDNYFDGKRLELRDAHDMDFVEVFDPFEDMDMPYSPRIEDIKNQEPENFINAVDKMTPPKFEHSKPGHMKDTLKSMISNMAHLEAPTKGQMLISGIDKELALQDPCYVTQKPFSQVMLVNYEDMDNYYETFFHPVNGY